MRLMLITLICLIPGMLRSQHVHFVYIQSDQQQTFYIKKAGEVISSSSSGFIILPKLPSGTHQFTIGFPKNQWPEYDFQVEVKSSDRGFTLKNFDEKGWGLFDLQSAEIIMGRKIEPPKAQQLPEAPKSNDPFSVILASAVGDEGIRETGLIAMTVSRPAPAAPGNVASKTTSTAPPVARKEAVPEAPNPVSVPPPAPADQKSFAVNTPSQPEAPKNEAEALISAKSIDPGIKVETNPPIAKAELPTAAKTQVPPAIKAEVPPVAKAELPAVVKPEPEGAVKAEAKLSGIRKISEVKGLKTTSLIFVDMNGPIVDTVDVLIEVGESDGKQTSTGGTVMAPPANRANCGGIASEKDALSLRKKVLGMGDDEEMMAAIIKEVKAKCYTTARLQTVSYVFVNDKMRYRLYEESYPYIYDPANYAALERLLNSDEYISKFRTLIKTN
jgi:hypothetical protein